MKKSVTAAAFILLNIFLLWALPVFSAGPYPEITAKADKKTATVGETIIYTVRVSAAGPDAAAASAPEEGEYYPPADKDSAKNKDKKNEADGQTSSDTAVPLYTVYKSAVEKGEAGLFIAVNIAYYRPGSYSLPEIEIKGADGVKIGYAPPSIEIKELNPEAQFEEIEPPMELSGNMYRLIFVILAAAALGALILYLIKRYAARKAESEKNAPPVPPYEIFIRELEKLDPENLIKESRVEEYAFGLSIIFRRYISALYKFDASEMTSDEILTLLKKGFRRETSRAFSDIESAFMLWDLAKYAEFSPTEETLKLNLEAARSAARKISREVQVAE